MKYGIIKNTLDAIDKNDYSILASKKFTEEELARVALGIKKRETSKIVYNLIEKYMEEYNCEAYDWNMGSILSHIDFGIVLNTLSRIDSNQKPFLYDSIGLSWLLGESNSKNKIVIDFLEKTIRYARNSTSWWNAAYSLKEIDGRNAIKILKKQVYERGLKKLDYYFDNLDNKRSLIGILIYADTNTVKNIIYPKLIEKLADGTNEEKANIIWILGRLRLFNKKAFDLVKDLLDTSEDYDLIYQIFKAMEENPNKEFYHYFKKYLKAQKPLLIKLSIRGIAKVGNAKDIDTLKEMIMEETDDDLISELSKAIYTLEDNTSKKLIDLRRKYNFNETGLIFDSSNNWYSNPELYENFSYFEDKNRIVFGIIADKLKNENHVVKNPIDLGTGTGRTLDLIYENIEYEGTLYGIDNSPVMLDYLSKTLEDSKRFVKPIQLVESAIVDFEIAEKSSFIISSFGFPSKTTNRKLAFEELATVYENLTDDGLFITYGWDEYFNDELIEMWYKYVPDGLRANNFEHWRNKKQKQLKGARNCGLNWYKRGIKSKLKFDSVEESVKVMGQLFGRDCIDEILQTNKRSWWMSYGITCNTKEEIALLLKEYEDERN